MNYPNKFIVVGMRFSTDAMNLINRNAIRPGDIVNIQFVANSEATGGIAAAVIITDKARGVPFRLGYVREADLVQCKAAAQATSAGTWYPAKYQITSMYKNYIVIELADKQGVVSNPCREVVLDNIEKCTLNPEDKPKGWPFPTGPETTKTKENTMTTISANFRNSFFREVPNVVLDFQTSKLAVKCADGIAAYVDGAVTVNPITEFSVAMPAFAMRVPAEDLNPGDIIITNDATLFFNKKTETGFEVITTSGEVKQLGNVTNLFFGKNTVLAVKNIFGDTTGMNPLMMAMVLGDGKMDTKTLMLMSMMGGGAKGMDPNMLMMLALAGK